MLIDPHRIALILRKEWLEIRQQRGLLLSMVFLPLLFTVLPLGILYIAGHVPPDEMHNLPSSGEVVKLYPALAGLSAQELAQAVMGPPLSVLLLLSPVIVPSIIASYSIVGEKVSQTLEPLLATPVTTWELLLAKVLSSLVPAVGITWLFGGIFVVGVAFEALSPPVFQAIISPAWLLLLLLCAPLLALIAISATVAVSSRVNDPRSAQQISAVVILPVMALVLGQFTGLLVLSPVFALATALVLALVAVVATWIATRLFQREAILTRWS
jgi:ABC-2 type transport system permease protein